jgi:hypothetical protein
MAVKSGRSWTDVLIGTASSVPASIMIAGVELDVLHKLIVTLAAFIGLILSAIRLYDVLRSKFRCRCECREGQE